MEDYQEPPHDPGYTRKYCSVVARHGRAANKNNTLQAYRAAAADNASGGLIYPATDTSLAGPSSQIKGGISLWPGKVMRQRRRRQQSERTIWGGVRCLCSCVCAARRVGLTAAGVVGLDKRTNPIPAEFPVASRVVLVLPASSPPPPPQTPRKKGVASSNFGLRSLFHKLIGKKLRIVVVRK